MMTFTTLLNIGAMEVKFMVILAYLQLKIMKLDWKRCGLPMKRNRDDSNVKVRAKRHTHHRHHHKHHRHLGDDSDEVRKVMGGKPVEDGELPWAVSLYENGILRCTGTLVTKRHVLTAAHCFSKDDGVDLTLDNW